MKLSTFAATAESRMLFEQLMAELNVTGNTSIQEEYVPAAPRKRAYYHMFTEIDLSTIGVMALGIQSLKFSVMFYEYEDPNEEGFWGRAGLAYKHTDGGTNGYTVADVCVSDDRGLTIDRRGK